MGVREAIEDANAILPGTPAPDDEEDPRWQAIITVGNYIDTDPEDIWQFVVRWGSHTQEDLRTAIATCLLEHLLENHFDLTFPRVSELVKKNQIFADTFSQCWKMGQSELPGISTKFVALMELCRGAADY